MLEDNFQRDIANIQKITIIPTLLDVICQTTGMGFAAVARVTDDRWITCSVKDNVSFGLKPGDELEIRTTICNEIRQDRKAVIIDNVSEDEEFRYHHTPAMYGLQSYISVPIINQDGSFFGTLCAIDSKPNQLKTFKIREMFNLFAELISFHINSIEKATENENILQERNNLLKKTQKFEKLNSSIEQKLIEKNISLEKMNSELEAFNYISSHDLQEPLRKIQLFTDVIEREEVHNLSEKGKTAFQKIKLSAFRMQNLISDLLIYSKTKFDDRKFEVKDLNNLVRDVIDDLTDEFENKNVTFNIQDLGKLAVIEFQFRQLLYNLINNSLKFASPDRNLIISVSAKITNGMMEKLSPLTRYYQITIEDNGIGFDQSYNEKIFGLFQALHTKPVKSTGIGLTIVKRIVENHNGFIKAEGVLNKGAKFDIFIPLE